MKGKIRAIIVKILTLTIGNLLVFVQPQKAAELSEKGMTNLRDTSRLTWKEKLIRRSILNKAKKKGDVDSLAKFYHHYWANQGHDFFSSTKYRIENVYLPEYKLTCNALQEQLLKEPNQFRTLVEIGTGDGSVLDYLSSKFPEINSMAGIDLSEVQIENNKVHDKENPKPEFVAADGLDWVEKHGHENMVFVTFRGVLEYFAELRLQEFIKN